MVTGDTCTIFVITAYNGLLRHEGSLRYARATRPNLDEKATVLDLVRIAEELSGSIRKRASSRIGIRVLF